jgi:hypothetical protein
VQDSGGSLGRPVGRVGAILDQLSGEGRRPPAPRWPGDAAADRPQRGVQATHLPQRILDPAVRPPTVPVTPRSPRRAALVVVAVVGAVIAVGTLGRLPSARPGPAAPEPSGTGLIARQPTGAGLPTGTAVANRGSSPPDASIPALSGVHFVGRFSEPLSDAVIDNPGWFTLAGDVPPSSTRLEAWLSVADPAAADYQQLIGHLFLGTNGGGFSGRMASSGLLDPTRVRLDLVDVQAIGYVSASVVFTLRPADVIVESPAAGASLSGRVLSVSGTTSTWIQHLGLAVIVPAGTTAAPLAQSIVATAEPPPGSAASAAGRRTFTATLVLPSGLQAGPAAIVALPIGDVPPGPTTGPTDVPVSLVSSAP